MWYGDPRDARRAARHAARAARHAQRAAYYQYGYRYRRPGRWFIGPFVLAAIFFFALPSLGKGIAIALTAIAVCGLVFWVIRANARRSYQNYQQPPYYQPQQPPQQQPYSHPEAEPRGYEQGYAASQPQEKQPEEQYYYPPQTPYEQPQAQYPEQMPPMQQ
ncbi:hypothetical protein KSF_083620 [Reticulibacter mediterranei]|uniref:Uncharacterized protein n=1 Tax=Reticulibacter mediterranei TaxID=2778369 RepID=A0A8J3IUW2_9CHLR|nr:hypothetical protein [Reticulibacter mediterranei]GHO98314.1 hypothetical protein KSF_083620 [Reticulibacter mediterranei]